MTRRLLNFLTALSLLLCVAVVALWVRTSMAMDAVYFPDGRHEAFTTPRRLVVGAQPAKVGRLRAPGIHCRADVARRVWGILPVLVLYAAERREPQRARFRVPHLYEWSRAVIRSHDAGRGAPVVPSARLYRAARAVASQLVAMGEPRPLPPLKL
jgi:hypothetical protein